MASREKALTEMRLIHTAFLVTIFLLIFITRFVASPERPVSQEIVLAIAAVAVADIAVGFIMRKRFMDRASESIISAGEQRALGAWRLANIYSFAHAETMALFGFVLKILGASWQVAGPFFCVIRSPAVVDAADGAAGFHECGCSAATSGLKCGQPARAKIR